MKVYSEHKETPVIKESRRHRLSFTAVPKSRDLSQHDDLYSNSVESCSPRKEAVNLKINNKLSSPIAIPTPESGFPILRTNELLLSNKEVDESGLELERYYEKLLADVKGFRVPWPLPRSSNNCFPPDKKSRSICKEDPNYVKLRTGDSYVPSSASLILNDRTLLKISKSLSAKHASLEEREILKKQGERSVIRNRIKSEVTLPHCLFASGAGENSCGRIRGGCWIGGPQLQRSEIFCYQSLTPLPPQKLSPSEVASTLPSLSPPLSFQPSRRYNCSCIANGSRGICSTLRSEMKGKGNRSSAASTTGSNQQVVTATNQSVNPRTPGTPSDAGAHTPNPPTPGSNNSSNTIVGSASQYVAITVEAGPSGGTDNEMSSGGNSYVTYVEGSDHSTTIYETTATTAAANGQTMSYPLYVSGGGDTATTYGSGSSNSSHYFGPGSSNNGVTYTQDGAGVYLVQSPASSNNNNIISVDGGGGSSSNLTNRVSPATKRRKTVPELCPISAPVGATTITTQRIRRARQEMYYDDADNVYMVEEMTNANHATTYVNSGGDPTTASLVPELDNFGYDSGLPGVASGSDMDMESQFDTSGDDHLYSSGGNAAAIRTNPLTVQWLLENYETAEGVSLPRSTLYNHYLRHCSEHKLDPVNAASFGKLIRSVFLGLRTRRLGTRGNSKYHYYGIRLKPNSPLNHVKDDVVLINGNYASNGHHNASAGNTHRGGSNPGHQHQNGGGNGMGGGGNANKRPKPMSRNDMGEGGTASGLVCEETAAFLQYLGESTGSVLEDIPQLDAGDEAYSEGVIENDLFVFRTLYREHCKALLDALVSFQLQHFEVNWKMFWRGGDMTEEAIEGSVDYEKILPKSKMLMISKMKVVHDFVKVVDYNLYQHIVEMLLPDVLRPIPSGMTQAIRNFAKVLESWVSFSMIGYPESLVSLRLTAVSSLAQTLRRYTSLNHLAQAARAVLQNQSQISQMLADLNRVDFRNVEEQASWVCGCVGDTVSSLEQDFKATLSQQQTLDEWASWLEKVVDKIMKPYENSPNFVSAARNFLLKWSFYSSLIIRDLTLRSAASFGSFHLLRLLYDEYIFYVVEHRVAKVSGVVPIQVIGKKSPGLPFAESPTFEQQQQRVETGRKESKSNVDADGSGTDDSLHPSLNLQKSTDLALAVSPVKEGSRKGNKSSLSD